MMTEQAPAIRTAEKDDEGPAKRRRRPALSCVECRSRKVRCDRGKPCGACTRIRSQTCTFRPQRAGVRESSPGATSASAIGSNGPDHRISARASPQAPASSNQFDLIVNRYVAPGIFGEHGRSQLHPLPTNRPSFSLNSCSNSGDSVLVGNLLERIRSLESKGALIESRPTSTVLPVRQASGPGQFIKSRFYGQSHWMNAIEPVSLFCFAQLFDCTPKRQRLVTKLNIYSMNHWDLITQLSIRIPIGLR
jgi:hypothetical protein